MTGIWKIGCVLLLVAAVAVVIHFKPSANGPEKAPAAIAANDAVEVSSAPAPKPLPRLVDLGADKCIPCKKMAPILEELRKEQEGKLEVLFIDVWKNPDAANPYNINLIPTQIFFGADGKELFRHEGFFPKEDILAKWKELGVELAVSNGKATS
jgi:thioredoxin 1